MHMLFNKVTSVILYLFLILIESFGPETVNFKLVCDHF